MVRKRFADLDDARREGLLEAAATEFADRGYEGASVNRIIADAGISKGSLYYYFEDKQDLFATVLEQATSRMMAYSGMPVPDQLTADNFWNSFREFILRAVDYLNANEWFIRLTRSFLRFRHQAPDSPAIRRMMDTSHLQLEAILARGQAVGVVRTDLPLPLLVEMTLAVGEAGDRWQVEHWNESAPDLRLTWAEAHMDAIRDMLHAKNQGWEE